MLACFRTNKYQPCFIHLEKKRVTVIASADIFKQRVSFFVNNDMKQAICFIIGVRIKLQGALLILPMVFACQGIP